MRTSLRGHQLPESEAEFNQLAAQGTLRYRVCQDCEVEFSPANTFTRLGWAEGQISGVCEDCFNALFEEPDNG